MLNDNEVDARQEDREEEIGLEVWGRPCTADRTCASSPLSFMVGCVLYVFNAPLSGWRQAGGGSCCTGVEVATSRGYRSVIHVGRHMMDPWASRTRSERETPSELGRRDVMRPSRQELRGCIDGVSRRPVDEMAETTCCGWTIRCMGIWTSFLRYNGLVLVWATGVLNGALDICKRDVVVVWDGRMIIDVGCFQSQRRVNRFASNKRGEWLCGGKLRPVGDTPISPSAQAPNCNFTLPPTVNKQTTFSIDRESYSDAIFTCWQAWSAAVWVTRGFLRAPRTTIELPWQPKDDCGKQLKQQQMECFEKFFYVFFAVHDWMHEYWSPDDMTW